MSNTVTEYPSDEECKKINPSDENSKKEFIKKFSNVFFDSENNKQLQLVVFLSPCSETRKISSPINDNLEDSERFSVHIKIIKLLTNIVKLKLAYLSLFNEYRDIYNIKTDIPTYIIFKNGKEVARFESEYTTVSEIVNKYNSFV